MNLRFLCSGVMIDSPDQSTHLPPMLLLFNNIGGMRKTTGVSESQECLKQIHYPQSSSQINIRHLILLGVLFNISTMS